MQGITEYVLFHVDNWQLTPELLGLTVTSEVLTQVPPCRYGGVDGHQLLGELQVLHFNLSMLTPSAYLMQSDVMVLLLTGHKRHRRLWQCLDMQGGPTILIDRLDLLREYRPRVIHDHRAVRLPLSRPFARAITQILETV